MKILIVILWVSFLMSNTLLSQTKKLELIRFENLPSQTKGTEPFTPYAQKARNNLSKIQYFLEEGKLVAGLNWTKGFQVSKDSIIAWGCLCKSLKESKFFFDLVEKVEYITEKSYAHDSIFQELIYLEILEDESIDVKYAICIVELDGEIVKLDLKKEYQIDELPLSKIRSNQKGIFNIPQIPMPSMEEEPIDRELTESERHLKAMNDFDCKKHK